MNKFSAEEYVGLMTLLANLQRMISESAANPKKRVGFLKIMGRVTTLISTSLSKIGCELSAKAAARFSTEVSERWSGSVLAARVGELHKGIMDELNGHLFFWVPTDSSRINQNLCAE